MRMAFLSPALIHLQPTHRAHTLSTLLARLGALEQWRAVAGSAWESAHAAGESEARALTFELAAPAHDAVARAGASFRVLHPDCWLHGRSAHATLAERAAADPSAARRPAVLFVGRTGDAAAAVERARAAVAHYHSGEPSLGPSWSRVSRPLPWRHQVERTRVDPIMGAPLEWSSARDAATRTRCGGTVPPLDERLGTDLRRPLNWLVPPSSDAWPVNCVGAAEALCAVVRRVAVGRAVMAAVANKNIAHENYLGRFVDLVVAANVTNFIGVALDNTTGEYLGQRGVSYYVRRFVTRTGADSSSTGNHATSALKFEILTELLRVGVSVLLSDVDVPVLANPFAMLYRDSDIENMSDGWDDRSTCALHPPLFLCTCPPTYFTYRTRVMQVRFCSRDERARRRRPRATALAEVRDA